MKPSELAKLADMKPQQVYNYLSQNRIPGAHRRIEDRKWEVNDHDGEMWAKAHRQKREEREEKNRLTIEAQLRGEKT